MGILERLGFVKDTPIASERFDKLRNGNNKALERELDADLEDTIKLATKYVNNVSKGQPTVSADNVSNYNGEKESLRKKLLKTEEGFEKDIERLFDGFKPIFREIVKGAGLIAKKHGLGLEKELDKALADVAKGNGDTVPDAMEQFVNKVESAFSKKFKGQGSSTELEQKFINEMKGNIAADPIHQKTYDRLSKVVESYARSRGELLETAIKHLDTNDKDKTQQDKFGAISERFHKEFNEMIKNPDVKNAAADLLRSLEKAKNSPVQQNQRNTDQISRQ